MRVEVRAAEAGDIVGVDVALEQVKEEEEEVVAGKGVTCTTRSGTAALPLGEAAAGTRAFGVPPCWFAPVAWSPRASRESRWWTGDLAVRSCGPAVRLLPP